MGPGPSRGVRGAQPPLCELHSADYKNNVSCYTQLTDCKMCPGPSRGIGGAQPPLDKNNVSCYTQLTVKNVPRAKQGVTEGRSHPYV